MSMQPDDVRVVIVDDNKDVRELLRMNLQMDPRFACVGEADNGGAGLDEVLREKPDAVILDLNMPGLDGLSALRLLQRDAPDTKVVVYSAMYDRYDADDLLAHRAHLYVDKTRPVTEVLDEMYRVCRP